MVVLYTCNPRILEVYVEVSKSQVIFVYLREKLRPTWDIRDTPPPALSLSSCLSVFLSNCLSVSHAHTEVQIAIKLYNKIDTLS